ncbi:MAG: xanthine dehydrogenase molybdenum-binding subunit XdhA [Eubacteriales bacterium]|nr:xanthine dehydrogenase molybdenum-binding subunit XdhA [Eubacteriales bacterium]
MIKKKSPKTAKKATFKPVKKKVSDLFIPIKDRTTVGKPEIRVDARAKVTGDAKYTNDLCPRDAYCAKVLFSTIANGEVIKMDIEEALKVEDVVAIYTCFDVPDHEWPSAGHPFSLDPSHKDPSDRKILNKRVRIYGDDIAVVVAKNEVACDRALRLIKVEYNEFTALTNPHQAMEKDATVLHPNIAKTNAFAHTTFKKKPDFDYEKEKQIAIKKYSEENLVEVVKQYKTPHISHCHIELANSYAYIAADGKITVVSSTQIPHICRRIVADALQIGVGKVRIIKPYLGGGFGNKQDVLYEPLVAWLTTKLNGHCVYLELPRENNISGTRTRHAMEGNFKSLATKDGTLLARDVQIFSDNGGYAGHGHSIAAKCSGIVNNLYRDRQGSQVDTYSVYTNTATAAAMRAYGIPQACWFAESNVDDICHKANLDPLKFRYDNCADDTLLSGGVGFYTYGLKECMKTGAKAIGWGKKRKEYANQSGNIRHGIGMGIFIYQTAVWPISMEQDGAMLILNQDGSANLLLGATEIGQGGDTVFTQMAADACGFTFDQIHIVSTQDTDYSPFGTGAYGSRQTYVAGRAAKRAGIEFKRVILEYACKLLKRKSISGLDIVKNKIIDKKTKKKLMSVADVAIQSYYNKGDAGALAVRVQEETESNSYASGAVFVDVTVDMAFGKIKVDKLVACHDSGILINPALAKAQVQGGISMSLGFGLSEEILYDEKTAKPLNNNLLDYKIPTAMDSIDSEIHFIQLEDPSAPYGNKALGEPPAILPSVAIRNAILNATGVAFDQAPMTPQRLVEGFKASGLI